MRVVGRVAQVLSLVFVILVLGHWNGCLQWFVPMLQQYPGDSWAALENLIESDWLEQYTWALFKALSHMLSIGFGRYPPQSTTDVWLTILSMLTGATCYALFVGQSTTIIQSFGISKRLYQEKFQKVEEYMSYRNLPRNLRRSIGKYYEHRYRGKMFDEPSILAEVNECLHEEIVNFNCRTLISSVSFFETADRDFVTDLVSNLIGEVYLPGNMIVKEGTIGNKMFFLQEGAVSILSRTGKCVAKLYDGSYFGEVCLLRKTRRVASVRADSFCNVFTLSVEHFLSVLERYPNMRTMMKQIAKKRFDDFGKEIKMENCIGNGKSRDKDNLKTIVKLYKKLRRRRKKGKKRVQVRNEEAVNLLRKNLYESSLSRGQTFDYKKNKAKIFKSISSSPGALNFSELKKKKNHSFSGLGLVALKSVGGRLDALTLEALTGLDDPPSQHIDAAPEAPANEVDDDDGGIYFKVKSDTVITTLDVQD